MAMKSFAVPVTDADTDIVVCPVASSGAVVLQVSNITGGASTYTLSLYRQALGVAQVIASSVAIAANTMAKVPAPLSLESGDKVILSAPAVDTVVASGTFTYSASSPVEVGFTPRGEWSDLATYARNDYVSYTDGSTYVSRVDGNVDNEPDSSPAEWQLFSQRGAPGAGDLSSYENLNDVDDKPTSFNNIKQPATDSYAGVVELTEAAEVASGADAGRAITPASVLSSMGWLPLTAGAAPSVNHAEGVNRKITHTENATIGAPSNAKVGWPLNFWIVPGAFTTAWNAVFKFGDVGAPDIDVEGVACFICLDNSNFVFMGFREKA